MSEAATPEAPAQEPQAETATTDEQQPKVDETDWKAEARKWEQLAKKNNTKAEKAAEQARLDAMSESERAIEEARQSARTEAAHEYGKRLAKSEIRAAAAGVSADLKGVFDYLDLGRFVGEDGEPDAQAIEAFVAALPKESTTPSFDGGSRTSPPAARDMNAVIRQAAGRA